MTSGVRKLGIGQALGDVRGVGVILHPKAGVKDFGLDPTGSGEPAGGVRWGDLFDLGWFVLQDLTVKISSTENTENSLTDISPPPGMNRRREGFAVFSSDLLHVLSLSCQSKRFIFRTVRVTERSPADLPAWTRSTWLQDLPGGATHTLSRFPQFSPNPPSPFQQPRDIRPSHLLGLLCG